MVTAGLAGVPTGVRAEIVRDDDPDWPGVGWPAGTLSLDDALARGRWIADAVGTARAMTAVDLAPAGAATSAAVVEGELGDRLSDVSVRYGAAVDELRAALAEPASPEADARVRGALATLADFGVPGARQAAQAGLGQPDPARRANAESILAATEAVVRVLEQPAVDVEGRTAALEAVFGPDFAVLPLVANPHGDWSAALAAGWSRDVIADTISEAAPLPRIRMVGPEEVPWLGRYLPALYLADNAAGDTLTISVHDLVAR